MTKKRKGELRKSSKFREFFLFLYLDMSWKDEEEVWERALEFYNVWLLSRNLLD